MANAIDICNLALSHLGDTATVASIDPPSGSAQSQHCARFYPIARDTLLEMHAWNFSTTRAALALLDETNESWLYVYAVPANVVNVISVLPSDAGDDYEISTMPVPFPAIPVPGSPTVYVPQPYAMETLTDGTQVILTNVEDAVLRYTVKPTDPTVFTPLFVLTLSWHLASMLAGAILKGDAGAAEGKRCVQMTQAYLQQARMSDSNQRSTKPQPSVPWIAAR